MRLVSKEHSLLLSESATQVVLLLLVLTSRVLLGLLFLLVLAVKHFSLLINQLSYLPCGLSIDLAPVLLRITLPLCLLAFLNLCLLGFILIRFLLFLS